MSYETAAIAIADTLPRGNLQKFTSKDVSVGDYSLLSQGHIYAVVVDYDGFDHERLTLDGGYSTVWHFELFIAVLYENDVQVHNDLRDLRQEIITKISENPGLGVNVFDAQVVRGEAIPQLIELGSGKWAFELVYVDVEEQIDYTEAD